MIFGNRAVVKLSPRYCYKLFIIRVFWRLSAKLINPFVKVASQDHTNNDCLAVAVLSTGTSGYLKADNMFYPAQMLWMPFLPDSCPGLIDKPKIFFLQVSYSFFFLSKIFIYFSTSTAADQSEHETNFP